MKKKQTLSILLFCIVAFSFAQERVLEFSNSLKTSSSNIKDVIPIVNKKNGDISMFIADAKNVYGYKFDENFQLLDKLSSEEKRRKYKILIGNSISDNGDYFIFLTNKQKNKFLKVKFSFKDKTTTSQEFKLKLHRKEKFIQTVSSNNKFYLISARKDVSALYIYSFDNEGNYKRNRINLTNLIYQLNPKKNVSAPYLLTFRRQDINKVYEDLPNSIEITAEKEKMYVKDNAIIFTFDGYNNLTQTLEIDLNNFSATGNIFKKPLEDIKSRRKKSNSFLFGNKLFLSATTKEKLEFKIVNFNSGEVIKEYSITKGQPITFKNTPIIQEGGMFDNYRELEKSKKFLRKINKDKFGISVRQSNNNYQVTIGGYVIQKSAGLMMLGAFGNIPVGSIGNVSVYFNPSMFAYNSMENTKSTRIECLFDKDLNHVKGEISKNVFEKIQENKLHNISGETIFKYKNYYLRGYYVPKIKKYYLSKYIDN